MSHLWFDIDSVEPGADHGLRETPRAAHTGPNTSPGTDNNDLYGVSCLPGGACTAIGDHYGPPGYNYQTLIVAGSGSSWTPLTSPTVYA